MLTAEMRTVMLDWLENSDDRETGGLRHAVREMIRELEARPAPPEPYSESNPPRENDVVLVDLKGQKCVGLVLFVFRRAKHACHVAFAESSPARNGVEYIDISDMALLFRPATE